MVGGGAGEVMAVRGRFFGGGRHGDLTRPAVNLKMISSAVVLLVVGKNINCR